MPHSPDPASKKAESSQWEPVFDSEVIESEEKKMANTSQTGSPIPDSFPYDSQKSVPTWKHSEEHLPQAEAEADLEPELAMHPLELVPGYNEPDYRGISDEAPEGASDNPPMTLRSAQLNPEAGRNSGVRSKTPEVPVEIKKKTG